MIIFSNLRVLRIAIMQYQAVQGFKIAFDHIHLKIILQRFALVMKWFKTKVLPVKPEVQLHVTVPFESAKQNPSFWHCKSLVSLQGSKELSQYLPVNNGRHTHVKLLMESKQSPPFLHGLNLHSSMFTEQFRPKYPEIHKVDTNPWI